MNKEEIDKVSKVESKLAAGWLELSQLISAFDKEGVEGVEVEDLKKGKAMIKEGLETIIVSLK